MSATNSLVATYADARLANAAIRKLRQAGFDMGKFSVVGDHPDEIEDAALVRPFESLDGALRHCVPPDYLSDYQAETKAGRVILAALGPAEEIAEAQRLIAGEPGQNWDESADCAVYYGCG